MPIIILNAVHLPTHLVSVSYYLHCARVLRLHDAFLPLQQLTVFWQEDTLAFEHIMNVHILGKTTLTKTLFKTLAEVVILRILLLLC